MRRVYLFAILMYTHLMKRWVLSLVLATFSAVPAGLAFTDDANIHYAPAVQSVASKGG